MQRYEENFFPASFYSKIFILVPILTCLYNSSISEFVTATVNRNDLLKEEKLRAAFRIYDKDDSGSISLEELKTIIGVG